MKRMLSGVIVCAALLFAVSPAHAVLEAYYQFDETSNFAVSLDSSGNGIHGTYLGGATADVGGAPGFGSGVQFDGMTGLIQVGNPSTITGLTNGFALTAWINPERVTGAKQRIFGGLTGGWGAGLINNGMELTTFGVRDYDLALGLQADQWQHVAYVLDTNNDVTFYVNGNPVGTVAHTAPGNATTSPFAIGRASGAPEFFQGRIDEVAVFSNTLTQPEIQAIMANGVAGAPGPVAPTRQPVLRYDYNSSDPLTNIMDSSGAGNNGVATAGVAYSTDIPAIDEVAGLARLGTGNASADLTMGSGMRSIDIGLITNPDIAANGGFTIETWVKRTADTNLTSIEKIIDLGGLYNLRVIPSTDLASFNLNGATFDLPLDEWHHLVGVFDSEGNDLQGNQDLLGVARFYVDGEQLGAEAVVTLGGANGTSFLNTRPIGIGKHPTIDIEHFRGLLFDTRVTLGALSPGEFGLAQAPAIPEPATGMLAMMGLGALLGWRRRRGKAA
jgi:MYXO-CTERM domain-containing protein